MNPIEAKTDAAKQPQPKRRILICVTGLSPQIVTETLFALSVSQTPRWVPDEIRLITTQRGADNARLTLLSDNPGWFHRLCRDWQLPPIAFDTSHIEVLQDAHGKPLEDMVDIMTPHQSHYYQGKAVAGSTSPHDSGSPNPISFLTVPPKSQFAFHVVCDSARLADLAPDLAHKDRWKALLTEAFEHAFAWLGFGAKTSVGYGAMDRDTNAEAKLANAQAQAQAAAEQAAKMASLSDNARQVETFVQACQQKLQAMGANGKKDKANTDLHAKARALAKAALEGADWTAEEKRAAAEALAEWLPQVVEVDMKDERKKLKLAVLRGEA